MKYVKEIFNFFRFFKNPVSVPQFALFSLGNPGPTYSTTRHSVGHLFLDYLAQKQGLSWKAHTHLQVWEGSPPKQETDFQIRYFKSLSYMNLSGTSLANMMHYWKIDLSSICVIYDDMDLPFGACRLKMSGSAGGHNGVADIIRVLKKMDWARVKIGIGRPPHKGQEAHWVLSDFTRSELERLEQEIFPEVETKIQDWLRQLCRQRLKR